MKYLTIEISGELSEEEAQFFLEEEGLSFLYATEENGTTYIATSWYEDHHALPEKFPWILSITKKTYDAIDWEEQWQIHGETHVDLSPYGLCQAFEMLPGPGFGDLSHPTTRLAMELMIPLCKGKNVVDIGCGSGVLSLAAVTAGAHRVYALDIDPLAITHTEKNAVHNGFDGLITYELPQKASQEKEWLLVMNMIHSEQRSAWNSIKKHFTDIPYEIVTSGILHKDSIPYLEEVKQWGWSPINTATEGEWAVFHLTT